MKLPRTAGKVFCPDCSRLLLIGDDKKEGEEMECPFCLATFSLEPLTVFVGVLKKKSPFTVDDPHSPSPWEQG